jgi:hypothetical protein
MSETSVSSSSQEKKKKVLDVKKMGTVMEIRRVNREK